MGTKVFHILYNDLELESLITFGIKMHVICYV